VRGKDVIHTVGPIGENADKLASCYKRSLDLARQHQLRTIVRCNPRIRSASSGTLRLAWTRVLCPVVPQAFPCISTGIYGYPQQAGTSGTKMTMRIP